MDPPCPDDETDSGFQQFIWDQFERIQHDFEEFTNGILPNVEDSSNPYPYFTNINEANSRLPEVTNHQLANLLENFDEFEKTMLPPYEMNPTSAQDFSEQNYGGENQESYKVTQNGTGKEQQLVMEGTGDSNKNMNITGRTSNGATGDSQASSPFLTLANGTTYGGACGGGGDCGGAAGGGVARSFMKCGFFVQCYDRVNIWRWMGGRARVTAKTRQRRKKKYRRVYETEAMTALRLRRQKINNIATAALRLQREKINNSATAARSFEQKQEDGVPVKLETLTISHQAYDVQLQEQIQKLTK
ncbi:hypothetical protein RHSIM_Rhsim13G0138700 [Rhododendron simsii]|uniref:Uncharacterized protein n=1 Tax=Rhododendron simsii TaxID=118357 RepID=A0A834G177_RHOSS|nr:hypothetical protein RHSIM_Rhsim13G0138700 [Rhododendron simsii]